MIRKPVKDGLGNNVRDYYYDPSSQQIELKSNPPEHVSSSDPKIGSLEHKQKNPQLYGYRYVSKLEQALHPKLGTAPSEKAAAKKILNEYGPVKYDKNGYPDKATPEQFAAAAYRLERHRQMTGEPDKPKTKLKKINPFSGIEIPIPTVNYSLLRNPKEDAREQQIERLRVHAFTKSESDEDKGIGSLANTTGRKLRAAAAKDSWEKNREKIYEDK